MATRRGPVARLVSIFGLCTVWLVGACGSANSKGSGDCPLGLCNQAGPAGLEAARVAGERGHSVLLLEATARAGGQVRLAARNVRRRDLLGIVEWREAELKRLNVEVRYNTYADAHDVVAGHPDIVIVATGGLPQPLVLQPATDRIHTSWDVLGGDVRPAGDVLFFDDNGTHSALSAAEMIARSGANLEIVTPERMLGVEVGGMNHVPYARAFNQTDTRVTLNQRLLGVRPEAGRLCVELGSDQSAHRSTRHVDWVIVDNGVAANADLYFALKPLSTNLGALDYGALIDGRPQALRRNEGGSFALFRIGDAVASRNIHAAVYDALRLVKDL